MVCETVISPTLLLLMDTWPLYNPLSWRCISFKMLPYVIRLKLSPLFFFNPIYYYYFVMAITSLFINYYYYYL